MLPNLEANLDWKEGKFDECGFESLEEDRPVHASNPERRI